MQTINELALEEAKTALGNVSYIHRSCYTSIMALRQLCAEREEAFKINITNHQYPLPLDLGKAMSYTFTSMRGSNEFLNLKTGLDYAEALPEVIEALKTVSPFVQRVRELEKAIQDEREAANLARHALNEAEEAARAAAEAALAKDPSVISAREALAAALPALVKPSPNIVPVRGVIKTRPQLETV